MEFRVSYETVRFIDEWLYREQPMTDDARLRDAILTIIAADEEYWADQSMWRIYKEALKRMH